MPESLKNTLINFSINWEPYLKECRVEENGTTYFRNTNKHIAHKLFIEDLPGCFEELVDQKKYDINPLLERAKRSSSTQDWIELQTK
jgi:hypothetical protein